MGFPIRISPDQSLIDSSPKLLAVFHFLRRLLMPRHPPNALFNYLQIYRSYLSFITLISQLAIDLILLSHNFDTLESTHYHKHFKDQRLSRYMAA
jgi:hypothetical protein